MGTLVEFTPPGAKLLEERRPDGVVRLTLNDPVRQNRLDAALLDALHRHVRALHDDATVRVVLLTGAGEQFCAGLDRPDAPEALEDEAATRQAVERRAALLHDIAALPQPCIAQINGPASGFAIGLIAACDVALAADSAAFTFPETRNGTVPALIAPYILRAIGPRQARRYLLSAERISAAEAARIDLIHEIVPGIYLAAAVERVAGQFLRNGPHALFATKRLVAELVTDPDAARQGRLAVEVESTHELSDEAREGAAALRGKRPPRWQS